MIAGHRLDDPARLLLEMGALVQDQLRRASQALLEADHAAARHAIALDRDVDRLERRVDEASVRLLGQAPAAAEPRFVAAAMKAATELERIGGQACSLARRALADAGRDPALLPDIFRLVSAARSLERIAGHAASIAEMALFAAAGEGRRRLESCSTGTHGAAGKRTRAGGR